jgi:DNA-binding CsgD family transcriptional regulator
VHSGSPGSKVNLAPRLPSPFTSKGRLTANPAAWAAFERGAYNSARAIIGNPSSAEDARLLLVISLRERDWTAIAAAAGRLEQYGGDYAKLGRIYTVYAQRGRAVDAPAPLLERSDNPELDAELLRAHALVAWTQNRPNDVRRLLSLSKPRTATQRVQVTELRAWNDGLSTRLPVLLNALGLAIQSSVDVGLISIIAHHTAALARELDAGELMPRVRELLDAIEWRDLDNDERFLTERALAWFIAQEGDCIDALYRLDRIMSRARTALQQAYAAVDRARICALGNDPVNMAVAARHAFDAFDEIAWDTPQNDALLSAFGAVDVLYTVDPERTRALVHSADAALATPALGAKPLGLRDAYRNLAVAIVTEDVATALPLARAAYHSFKDLRYSYRAAAAALRAYDCSKVTHWRDKVAAYAKEHPRSPLARELAWRSGPLRRITDRRREILDRIAEHKTNREIAAALNLSENTVKEHIRVLNQLFGVNRRSALVEAWLTAKAA